MFFKEIIAVYTENQTTHKYTMQRYKTVKIAGKYNCH
jgi:hypothetical protein